MPYNIIFTPDAEEHLFGLDVFERKQVLGGIQEQLVYQPTLPTRNRKMMRPNPLAHWELRLGHLRVYYRVEQEPEPKVIIQAIGIKKREQVWIGNERYEL